MRGPARSPGRGPGLLLIVPAALTALATLIVPTGQTIVRSFQTGGGILGREPKSAGLQNYSRLLEQSAFWKALAFSLSLAIVPVLVILVIGPLLAAALDRAGTWPRRAGRLLLSLPLVVLSPVAVAGAWLAGQLDGGVATAFGRLRDVGPWSPTVPLITAAALFGFLCGLALLVFLPVMRGRAQGRPLTPTMLAVGSITVLAAIAVALQAFSFDLTLTFGKQATMSTLEYRVAYQFFDFGGGSAIATLTGLMLGVLGVLATIIAIRTGLRVELGPREPNPSATARRDHAADATRPAIGQDTDAPPQTHRPDGGGRAVVGILALVAVLAVTVLCSWPWLSAVFSSGDTPPLRPSAARVYANTWVPPVLGAIVSVGTAYLAALGIGGLRPLGRKSEWLLLPFAPWLFVGVTPLSVADFENARHLHLFGHLLGLVPPILLSVPSLLVLTLFCRTRTAHWRAQQAGGSPSFARTVALPALPLAVLMGGVTVFFGAQGLLWPTLVGTEAQTAPFTLLRQMSEFAGVRDIPYGIATPLIVVVLALLVLGTLQVLYLDRLVISTGPAGEPGDDLLAGTPLAAAQPPWPGPGYGPPPEYPAPPGPYGPPPGPYGPQPGPYEQAPSPSGMQPGPYGQPPGPPGQPPGPYGSPQGPYVPPPGSYGPPPIGHGPQPGYPTPPGAYGSPPDQPSAPGPLPEQPHQAYGLGSPPSPPAEPGAPGPVPGQPHQADDHGSPPSRSTEPSAQGSVPGQPDPGQPDPAGGSGLSSDRPGQSSSAAPASERSAGSGGHESAPRDPGREAPVFEERTIADQLNSPPPAARADDDTAAGEPENPEEDPRA